MPPARPSPPAPRLLQAQRWNVVLVSRSRYGGNPKRHDCAMPGNVICLFEQKAAGDPFDRCDPASSAAALTSLAWSLAHEMGHAALRHAVRGPERGQPVARLPVVLRATGQMRGPAHLAACLTHLWLPCRKRSSSAA